MCGFAGFVGFRHMNSPAEIARAMGEAIAHRGPDDWGVWTDDGAEVALVHRRLAIVDLSAAGHQPMMSSSERFVIAFNGEIYNHNMIRRELEREGHAASWRGHSDTETLLEAIAHWGVQRTLEAAVGMFAFALFDREERAVYLTRDRVGEKPLYYGRVGASFVFGSEPKAFARLPHWTGEIDRQAVAAYLNTNNVPSPLSIYRGIGKLPPGTMLKLDITTGAEIRESYWSVAQAVQDGRRSAFRGAAADAVSEAETLIGASIKDQLIADVPLGAFLSGGIDSTSVVALMQSISPRPVKTFTIGFNADGHNEAAYAKAVAGHLGTEHTELYVTEDDARAVIPLLPEIYSEPFADSSQIPTYLISKLARQHVTVALTGDGGDEVFGGYTRHRFAHTFWPRLARVPYPLRTRLASLLRSRTPSEWDSLSKRADMALPKRVRLPRPGESLHKFAASLDAASESEAYAMFASLWPRGESPFSGETFSAVVGDVPDQLSPLRAFSYRDMMGYLANDVLHKVDRAAMAVALETRVPLLDHRLIEFAWSLPDDLLIRNGETKWILREIVRRHVPPSLIDRPKMGFGVPLATWLRGALRDWAEDLLAPDRLRESGLYDVDVIRRAWDEHLSSARNRQHDLWAVLMLEAWRRSRQRHA